MMNEELRKKLYFDHDVKFRNPAFVVDLKNVLSYIQYTKERPLTSLEELELQECLENLRKGGFSNVVEALGF